MYAPAPTTSSSESPSSRPAARNSSIACSSRRARSRTPRGGRCSPRSRRATRIASTRRLEHEVRPELHHVAVLDRPRLALVGVDDDVARAGLARDRLPLDPGREARAAVPGEPGRLQLLDDPLERRHARGGARARRAPRSRRASCRRRRARPPARRSSNASPRARSRRRASSQARGRSGRGTRPRSRRASTSSSSRAPKQSHTGPVQTRTASVGTCRNE